MSVDTTKLREAADSRERSSLTGKSGTATMLRQAADEIDALRAERDELARWVLGHGYIGNARIGGWCANCQRSIGDGHKKGCPTALAERITKGGA